jgi:hypothetical protein
MLLLPFPSISTFVLFDKDFIIVLLKLFTQGFIHLKNQTFSRFHFAKCFFYNELTGAYKKNLIIIIKKKRAVNLIC